jgi:alkanesulfonate monooxygenase SsuD/methylene tetrahydromethanopterin reductase-like flavin-dependent oxidoreductase (luciferase family)
VGRDPATINKTSLCSVAVGATMEEAERMRNDFLAARGMAWDSLDDATRAIVGARLLVGDADTVGERVQEVMGLGLDGLTFNMPANGHDLEAVTRTVQVIKAAVG